MPTIKFSAEIGEFKMTYESMFPCTQLGGTARKYLAEIAELGEAYIALVYWHTSMIEVCFSEDMKSQGLAELEEMDENRAKALGVLERMLVNKISDFNTVCRNISDERTRHIQD